MSALAINYDSFIERKSQIGGMSGFKPLWMPDFFYDFQANVADWSIRKGRCADLLDCGMGKTIIQLVWAQNVVMHTNMPVLIATPLAVASQTVREGEKFGIQCHRSKNGQIPAGAKIIVTNYERLHYFDPNDFAGMVCDESSAIKDFKGARQKSVTEFMRTLPYRLLCTATAAPNDYIELGTSAEALGEMGRMDMLGMFFRNDENSLHPIWWGARWQLKPYAEQNFWRWVCSWARCVRKPSDLGFDDGDFVLPPVEVRETIVENKHLLDGFLFPVAARTLAEQREERRLTIKERCEAVVNKVGNTGESAVVWCHLNPEGDMLEKIIPGAQQVKGSHSDEQKEELFDAFSQGQLRVLVTKPKIGALGLNWQHCHHMTFFPSHSFEQYYQGVRRCWRFGQKHKVTVDLISSEGECGVAQNMKRKEEAANKMYDVIVREMNNAMRIERSNDRIHAVEVPSWL